MRGATRGLQGQAWVQLRLAGAVNLMSRWGGETHPSAAACTYELLSGLPSAVTRHALEGRVLLWACSAQMAPPDASCRSSQVWQSSSLQAFSRHRQ